MNKNIQKNITMFSLIKKYQIHIGGLFFCALLVNGITLFFPKIIANAIDMVATSSQVSPRLIFLFVILAIGVLFISYIQNFLQAYTAEKVAYDLRKSVVNKISRQSFSDVDVLGQDTLLTNTTSDIDGVKTFVSQVSVTILSSVIMITGATILLVSINWKLALAILMVLPIIGLTFGIIFSRSKDLFSQSRKVIDGLNKVINESILGSMLVRVLGAQYTESLKFINANSKAKNIGLRIINIFAIIIPIITFVTSITMVIILLLGGKFVIGGSMTLGEFTAFNSYVALLIFPIIMIGFTSNMIAQAQASFERIAKVLNKSDSEKTGIETIPLNGSFSVNNIILEKDEKKIINNISFSILPKTKVAIIGPTAAGKTQLLYMLVGLVYPDSGTVKYGDVLLKDYEKDFFYNQIGFVFQESIIFNLSIRDNISFSKKVTEENLKRAIATAELDAFIASLPQGLDTLISERGTNLSGGQKQRIMLARALALNPKIIFLDDFTARVDTVTEKNILQNISKNYPDITLVSVTQKINTIEEYDSIIVLMEGEIVAQGTHEVLLKESPEYVQIVESQKSTNMYELHTQ